MSERRFDADAQLEESLRRIQGALAHDRHRHVSMVYDIGAAAGGVVDERVRASVTDRRQHRAEERERRREARARADADDLPRGVVTAIAAVVCVVMALTNPHLWWLVFVALGLGTDAAKVFGRARRARQMEAESRSGAHEQNQQRPLAVPIPEPAPPAPAAPPAPPLSSDPRVARIHELSEQILAELESGPPIVREVVSAPQATIGGLRQACVEIARREGELRAVLAAQEEGALVTSREALATRLADERDEIVRERLGQALRALDDKIAHRAALATAATRLEAENTRILYTLESLHMQLLRARSTDMGAPELGGKLRESLRELGTQIDAVAEALEVASAPAGAEPGAQAPPLPVPSTPDAAQAEQQAMARRAARAGQAQRG